MTDSFENWINSMSEEEFEDRIESEPSNGGFTDNQRSKALNLREPIEDVEAEQLIREQESGVREIQTTPSQVYDNRDLPKKRTFFEVVKDRLTRIRPKTVQQVVRPPSTTQPTAQPQVARPVPTIRQRISGFFSRVSKGFRRSGTNEI